MNSYYIESKAGVVMGIYEGDTEEAAVAALNADAGVESTVADWTIIAVTDIDQEWDAGATIYTLANGGIVVDSGRHKDHYQSVDAARAAVADEH